MLGPQKSRQLDDPIQGSLNELVPANHFYRHLERTLARLAMTSLTPAGRIDGRRGLLTGRH